MTPDYLSNIHSLREAEISDEVRFVQYDGMCRFRQMPPPCDFYHLLLTKHKWGNICTMVWFGFIFLVEADIVWDTVA